jgi:hypothetical protein
MKVDTRTRYVPDYPEIGMQVDVSARSTTIQIDDYLISSVFKAAAITLAFLVSCLPEDSILIRLDLQVRINIIGD